MKKIKITYIKTKNKTDFYIVHTVKRGIKLPDTLKISFYEDKNNE